MLIFRDDIDAQYTGAENYDEIPSLFPDIERILTLFHNAAK
jgi:hypothetical protein